MGEKFSIILHGAGAMGGALLRAWLREGLLDIANSAVIDPSPKEEIIDLCATHGLALNPAQDRPWQICVLAFKPQQMADIVPRLQWPDMDQSLVISILAGISIETIANQFQSHHQSIPRHQPVIVRAMPNLPASIGKGMSILCGQVEKNRRAQASALLAAAGEIVWVESENELDKAMAIAACGPAYVFLLVEALSEAGEALGLAPEIASKIAREMIVGSAALLEQDKREASQLRRQVTSPGGTTEAALAVLDRDQGLRSLMKDAVAAAVKRAQQLGT